MVKTKKNVEKFSPTQIRLGQRIGRQHGDCQRKHRIHESITDRVPIGAEKSVIRNARLYDSRLKPTGQSHTLPCETDRRELSEIARTLRNGKIIIRQKSVSTMAQNTLSPAIFLWILCVFLMVLSSNQTGFRQLFGNLIRDQHKNKPDQ